jgi:Glycine-rich domain-containing protein-like
MGTHSVDKPLPPAKGKYTDDKETRDLTPPPTYRMEDPSAEELTASLRKLDLSPRNDDNKKAVPTNDECIAHLKFLTVLAHLREEISESDGLFGIRDASADAFGSEKQKALAKIREKRWGVYVARAVDRFESWFFSLPASEVGTGRDGRLRMQDMIDGVHFERLVSAKHLRPDSRLQWTAEFMPPLDVLMVLHSFMLNPRSFLEDCIRHNRMPLWHAGFPWTQVDDCINSTTFIYTPRKDSIFTFEAGTSRAWDNLHDPPVKQITCPGCGSNVQPPWTDGNVGREVDRAFEGRRGFADKDFEFDCDSCSIRITHETLRLSKFRRDIELLQKFDLPLPGTILSVKGVPTATPSASDHDILFPNRLVLAGLGRDLNSITNAGNIRYRKMTAVRTAFESALRSRHLVSEAKGSRIESKSLHFDQKVSIRRMMSRYWENSSLFALDLVGAVLRQGIFVDKMKGIDWINSPALEHTMTRLIQRYGVFFQIMAENPGHVAVPTLDVDLAWHTHQLNCPGYFAYSVHKMGDEFIDHDDKIDENKLSDAFEWTSKRYQKITGGQIYSECLCWYCAAIRESHNNQSLFSSHQTSVAKSRALDLHDRQDISCRPDNSAHISAHNAVRNQWLAGRKVAAKQEMKLDASYHRAVYQARAKGKKPPSRDTHAMAYVWGYPVVVPGYAPYTADPCISGSMYSCNPSCMNTSVGAVGNCVAGSCGGGVSFGGCAGAASGCGAGASCAGGGDGGGGGGGGGCGGGG